MMTYTSLLRGKNCTRSVILQKPIVIDIVLVNVYGIDREVNRPEPCADGTRRCAESGQALCRLRRLPKRIDWLEMGTDGHLSLEALRNEAAAFPPGDDHFVYLVRTIDNAQRTGVRPHARQRRIIGHPHGAMHLNGTI